jgi:hypothetical protein
MFIRYYHVLDQYLLEMPVMRDNQELHGRKEQVMARNKQGWRPLALCVLAVGMVAPLTAVQAAAAADQAAPEKSTGVVKQATAAASTNRIRNTSTGRCIQWKPTLKMEACNPDPNITGLRWIYESAGWALSRVKTTDGRCLKADTKDNSVFIGGCGDGTAVWYGPLNPDYPKQLQNYQTGKYLRDTSGAIHQGASGQNWFPWP